MHQNFDWLIFQCFVLQVKQEYEGPKNTRDLSNVYAFVLYKQNSQLDVASVSAPAFGFNLTSFAKANSLQGMWTRSEFSF